MRRSFFRSIDGSVLSVLRVSDGARVRMRNLPEGQDSTHIWQRYVPGMVGYEENAFCQDNTGGADWNDPKIDLTKYSDNGVIGDAS